MIYFDNSATSRIKPPEVIMGVLGGLTKFSANPGRAGHDLSLMTSIEVMGVREKIRSHVGAESAENVIFTSNCSEALNYAIFGSAKRGGHIIITCNEHNSVYRPVEYLKKNNNVSYSVCQTDSNGIITAHEIEKLITPRTYLVVCNHISNVNGDMADIHAIGKLCFDRNILFLVDGAQSLGHEKIDMKKDYIDFLAVAGHKGLIGPQGSGALVINGNIKLNPLKHGGSGTNSIESVMPEDYPERLEAGTIATPCVLGLGAGITYVENHFEEIQQKIEAVSKYAFNRLEELNNIIIYTKYNNAKNGVIAFNVKNMQSTTVADILNQNGICVRAGLHCAPLKHRSLGTLENGCVRISFSHFNNTGEVDKMIEVLKTL